MRRYNQRLYRVTRSILSSDAEADDVVQDAYVRAYLHLAQFEGRASFATWLTRIAVHEALARKREHLRLVEIDSIDEHREVKMEFLTSTGRTPEQEALTRSVGAMLESAVDALPDAYRSVFMLREIEGLNTAETAECLELSEEAVKVRLHRGRALLRKEIYRRTGEATATAFRFDGARCDAIVAGVLARIEQAVRN
jgi:RNA polymerase sigma-70 factor (ECF subfamily)